MKLYKLTDGKNQTMNGTQWGENVTHTADGKSTELCNEHWLHAYVDPVLAVMMAPAHVSYSQTKMWEAEGTVGLEKTDKVGCTSLMTVREIPIPVVTTSQRVKFACLVAREVYELWKTYDNDGKWLKWYEAGCTKDYDTAYAAASSAEAAAYSAESAASSAYAAASSAEAAAYSAEAAASSAYAAASSAEAAAYSAEAASSSAYAAVSSAYSAASSAEAEASSAYAAASSSEAAASSAEAADYAAIAAKIDLVKLAQSAMNMESK